MSNEYLDRLSAELEAAGLKPVSEVVTNVEDLNLKTVLEMQRDTGVKYSDEQKEILKYRGNACILACAGSGKTTVSTHLIAKRIKSGEIKDVNKLIYTTYSKAGQKEMEDRLNKLLEKIGLKEVKVQVRTLHSFFLQVIQIFGVKSNILTDERSKYVKECCKEAGYTIKDDDLQIIDNLLSYQVNNLLSDKKTIECSVNSLDDLSLEQYTNIRTLYAKKKEANKVIDYDDMQSILYMWLCKFAKSDDPALQQKARQVKEYCQAVWTDFYIDEAQDVSKIQFEIIKAMITDFDDPTKLKCNLVFIGDDDQCLVEGQTLQTPQGNKNIEDVQVGDLVLTCIGHGETRYKEVTNVSKKEVSTDIVRIRTSCGYTIEGTTNHIGFARTNPVNGELRLGLIYNSKTGFRLKVVEETEKYRACYGRIEEALDIEMRSDRSDKAWILATSKNKSEMQYLLNYYSLKYGIRVEEDARLDIKRLNEELDNYTRGKDLLSEVGLSYDYPHYSTEIIEHRVFGEHTLTENNTYKSKIVINGDIFASGLKGDLNRQSALLNTLTKGLSEYGTEETVVRKALLTTKYYKEMPLGSMQVGMLIPILDDEDGRIVSDNIVSIETERYEGYVYDIEVPDTRNFIVNGIAVHNCIYQWRGSDPSIILSVGPLFDMRTFVLSTNYRCKSEIVDYAAKGVKHNSRRYSKSMQANENGGSVQIVQSPKEDLCSLSILALQQIKKWRELGEKDCEIAVLSRNNFHLAILSSMLLREGIYCNITNDMKLTNSYMYKDIKSLIELSQRREDEVGIYKPELTKSVLWKLCRYMSIGTAMSIGKFQDSAALSLEDTLGFLIKTFIIKGFSFDKKLNIPPQALGAIEYHMRKLSRDTNEDIVKVYMALQLKERSDRLQTLMAKYLETCVYMYKTKDKSRSIKGLILYVNNLIRKDGYDGMVDFLKATEQYERSKKGSSSKDITLTTIHSAKGREWNKVIMFASDNISSPNFDSLKQYMDSDMDLEDIYDNIDEERRLFYVGNTRAKEELLTITYNIPSVFVLESLGAFKHLKGGYNKNILDFVEDSTKLDKYKDFIGENIRDVRSKYYYNMFGEKVEDKGMQEKTEDRQQEQEKGQESKSEV